MEQSAIDHAVEALRNAEATGRPLDSLPVNCRPLSVDDGYAIQDALARRSREPVVGWKLAITTEAGQRRLDLTEPLAGRLFASCCHATGAHLSSDTMHMRVAEGEIAFRLSSKFPRNIAYDLETIKSNVADVYLAIEIPDSRFKSPSERPASEVVADNGYACAFILGPAIDRWQDLNLASLKVSGFRNNKPAGNNSKANFPDPWQGLVWLARDRARRGIYLEPGDTVTTGTRLPPILFSAGDRIDIEFEATGRVSVRFD